MSKVWWSVFIWAGLAVFFDSEEYSKGTLDSGINVAPGINIAPGTFGKNIKHSP